MNQEKKLKKNMPLLMILTIAGALIYALPYVRLYYINAFAETFGMTQQEVGLCGTAFGALAAIAYLFGGIIADKFSIRILLSISLIVTGAVGFILLLNPSPIVVIAIHGVWGVTSIMTFWPALMKAVKAMGSQSEQSKAYGFFEGGRGVVNAIYLAVAVAAFAHLSAKSSETVGIRTLITAYSVIAVLLGVLLFFLLRNVTASTGASNDVRFRDIGKVMRYPATWLMIAIVFTTYFMNMSFYYVGPYISETFGASAIFATILSTAAQYIRPFTAVGAGVLGDKINSSKVIAIAQVISIVAVALLLLTPTKKALMPVVIIALLLIYVAMYSTQSMHFATMEEENFPKETLGTVIGMICCLGYLPESICPALAGKLMDAYPGAAGYRYYFMVMGAVSVLGLVIILYWMRRTKVRRAEILAASKHKDTP